MKNSNTAIFWGEQPAYDADPTVWHELSHNNPDSFSYTATKEAAEELKNNSVAAVDLSGYEVTGGFGYNLNTGVNDRFLEIILGGVFTDDGGGTLVLDADSAADGATYLAFDKTWADSVYNYYSNMLLQKLELVFEADGKMMATASLLGGNAETRTVATYSSPTAKTVVGGRTGSLGLNAISFNGAGFGACVSKVTIVIERAVTASPCLANGGYKKPKNGALKVTGAIDVHFKDHTHYQVALNEETASISWVDTSGGKERTYLLPKVALTGQPNPGGNDDDVMASFEYTALLDDVLATELRISEVDA
ncbi:MAG: phage tail tube protein [Pseudomonadota bacterium]|nr:phage tail tube protein [Pseudomonadota bacterium]